ncbi:ribonuclease H [Trichonephila clavipes]|nr:ribonuclease H [Trichonephila clavipes]
MKALPRRATGSQHLFSCPSIVGALFKIDSECSMDILYSDRTLDFATIIKAEGFKTIDKYPKDDFIFAYTNRSSDEAFLNGEQAKGLDIFFDSKAALQIVLNRGSRLTEEILSCLFRLQELDKVCFLQWLPAHANITYNENADKPVKESRNLNNGVETAL